MVAAATILAKIVETLDDYVNLAAEDVSPCIVPTEPSSAHEIRGRLPNGFGGIGDLAMVPSPEWS